MYMIIHPSNYINYYSFFYRVSFNVVNYCLEDLFILKEIIPVFSCPGNMDIDVIL